MMSFQNVPSFHFKDLRGYPLKLVPSLKKRRLTYPKILVLVFTITAQVFTLGRVFGRATSLHESEPGDWSGLDYITLYSVPAESPRYQ